MIISRYLIKETGGALLAVSFIMLLIFLSNQCIRYLKYVASGKIAAGVVLQLIGLEIPYLLVILLPLGMFLSIIVTYGRLYAENEMHVMQSCGFSTQRLCTITMVLSMSIAMIVSVLALWVNPYLAGEKDKILKKNISPENILDTLIPGRFQVSGDDKKVVYVESIDRHHKHAKNLFIAEQKKNSADEPETAWGVLSAAEGYQARGAKVNDRFVVATDGFRYEGTPGQNEYKIIQFKKYAVRIMEQMSMTQHQVEEMIPTSVLWKKYRSPQHAAELQWRIAMPISALLLALLAIPFSYVRPRQSRYSNLFLAIIIYVIYINLLFVSRHWIEHKIFSIGFGMWGVHGLVLFLILCFCLLRQEKFSLLFRKKMN